MVKIRWDMHRWETEYVLKNLEDYSIMIEDQFGKITELEKARISQRPAGISEEDFAEWQFEIQSYEERYEKDFPSKIRYSFIVLLQIIFETRLRAMCDEISKRNSIKLKESNLRGASIERAKLFLSKVVNIQITNNEAWQSLSDLQKIRDCIVHTNGVVSKSRDKNRLHDISKKEKGISLDNDGCLDIGRDYCKNVLKATQDFFEVLFNATGFGPAIPVKE